MPTVQEQHTKKVILFVHYGDNWLRGSEIVLLELLKSAQENHYIPILWCNSEILAQAAKNLSIKVIMNNFVCLGYWTTPKWDIKTFIQQVYAARKIITDENIALVHCNNGAPCQWMAITCKLMKIPLVLHLHARYMLRDRLTLLFHCADHLIGVSRSVVSLFHDNEFQSQQVSVTYNGINPQRISTKQPRDIRAELAAKKDEFVILYMGSLIARKCVSQLLYAVRKLSNQHSIKLAIVGSGNEQDNLEKLICRLRLTDKVKIFPATDEVAKVYASNADCFISVPTEEVFGLTLAEASLAKLPIITTNISGINEIYSHQKNALLVPANNTNELASAIELLINNPKLRNELAENASAHISSTFSMARQFDSINQVYRALLTIKHGTGLGESFIRQLTLLCKSLVNKSYKRLITPFSRRINHDS